MAADLGQRIVPQRGFQGTLHLRGVPTPMVSATPHVLHADLLHQAGDQFHPLGAISPS
jgi:hypothetical protein